MRIVLLTHPEFLGLRSHDHFARWLRDGLRARGHEVALRRPQARARRLAGRGPLAKWAGYVDQYLLFPRTLRAAMRADPADTLYVFCDQALGPWIPAVAHRPHVVHCHDLLALRGALGLIPEHRVGLTGRIYQRWIRAGFRHARQFVSISERTRDDLHRFGGVAPRLSEVVYNGLNHPFAPMPSELALATLRAAGLPAQPNGCVLHVGGGQWYKNTAGVVRLYGAWARTTAAPPPLWLVSPPPDTAVRAAIALLPAGAQVRFLQGVAPDVLVALYGHARALLFPSLAEGFGWPIAEALACGCPVITTAEAPMTEVAGDAATYLPRLAAGDDVAAWAAQGADALARVLARSPAERAQAAAAGRARAARFDADAAIDRYLDLYARVLAADHPAAAERLPA